MRFRPYLPALLLLAAPLGVHAADRNGYTALYECRAGGTQCNVDVESLGTRACDQIITPSMAWSSINWSNNTICIANGDHTGKGRLTVQGSGTSSNYKVLRYYRGDDNNDEPWSQSDGNKAKIQGLNVTGSHWVIHRLTFPASSVGPSPRIQSDSNSGNQVFNRLLVEGGPGIGVLYYGYSQNCNAGSGYNNITVQNSVFRSLDPIGYPNESVAVDLQCGNNLRAVNNEIYDWVSHPIQLGHNVSDANQPDRSGIVVENNDLYVSPARHTQGGARAIAESPLSIKIDGTASSPVQVIHNRIWGSRYTDMNYCCNGEGGYGITLYDYANYILIKNNIIFENQIGVSNVARQTSFVGNLFYKIQRYDSGVNSIVFDSWTWGTYQPASNYEMYFNTLISATGSSFPGLDHSDVDVRCNVLLSSGPKNSGNPPSSTRADRNAFYDSPAWTFNGDGTNVTSAVKTRANSTYYAPGDIVRLAGPENCRTDSDAACFLYRVTAGGTTAGNGPQYCTSLGCTTEDGSVSLQAIRGPYTFYRKLRTNPEPYTIPYARVHVSAPEAYGCPSDFGTRQGIGINNES
ncbi:hypothetical protein SVA_1547 [Sulfurifustis variabilis]|uniref:Right handed beta helix domain-containing protein n=1 Tax=Sulfurifustis variabilis TaxID=1675686 RepID=A0A1B4V3H1_9GAMM|nr:hypothetical protein [Sulfurifustis variabilis]BAU48109.1 hypothetical protein SVA_1547 [Sulfurifustis variabilis]